ncbi:hypothetical protein KI387_043356, partial [Taxus chinensis]
MDYRKTVTCGHGHKQVNVWDAKMANRLVSLNCRHCDHSNFELNGMAVKGTNIVTAICAYVFSLQ